MKYSVLMSVYGREKPANLSISLESMFNQTLPPDEIVLVEDGELTSELSQMIEEKREAYGVLKSVKLEKNSGLGAALNAGLAECENEYVARMDSDDIAFPERMEKQMAYLEEHPEVDILSCSIAEFSKDTDHINAYRRVPADNTSIISYCKSRTPFNHVGVVFKKSKVLEAGSYKSDFMLVEDHELWVRMLMQGAVGANLTDTLVWVRCGDDMHKRRRGGQKIKSLKKLYKEMLSSGFITPSRYMLDLICGCSLQMMPVWAHKLAYKLLRSSKTDEAASVKALKPVKAMPAQLYIPTEEEDEEARRLIFEIYTDVRKVCERHGLTLLLSGGSCLGAVRHHGFIPWDDDMDAIMPRADYERLKQVFDAELSDKYTLQVPNHPGSVASNTFMKIIMKNGPKRTELLKQNFPGENGLWLDICPMDYCPEDKYKRMAKGFAMDALKYAVVSRFIFKYSTPLYRAGAVKGAKGYTEYALRMALGFVLSFKPTGWWYDLFDRVSQGKTRTNWITFPSGIRHYMGESHPIDVMLPPAEGQFGDETVLLPGKAHVYLRQLYGADYMKPVKTNTEHYYIK